MSSSTKRRGFLMGLVVTLIVAIAVVSHYIHNLNQDPDDRLAVKLSSVESSPVSRKPNEKPRGSPLQIPNAAVVSPGYQPPPSEDATIFALVDRRKPLPERIPPDINSRIRSVNSALDIQALVRIMKDTSDHATARNEAMNLLRRSSYKQQLVHDLIVLVDSREETEKFRGYCIQHLMHSGRDLESSHQGLTAIAEIISRLDDPSEIVSTTALWTLALLDHDMAKKRAVKTMSDPNASVLWKETAIHVIGRLRLASHVDSLRNIAGRDEELRLRIAAIAELGAMHDERSRQIFEAASRSKHYRLRSTGKIALKKLNASD